MSNLKYHLKKQQLLLSIILTALIVGLAVYSWQYFQRRSLQQSNNQLKAQLDQSKAARQGAARDKDSIIHIVRADYLADPAHKSAPQVKIDKIESNFALISVKVGSESYKVVTKKVAADWVIIIKSKSLPDYALKQYQVPSDLVSQ